MLDMWFYIINIGTVVFNKKERKMKGFKVYLIDGDREIMKIGSINQSVMLEKKYDVLTD